jgi:hypothetical protein
MGFTFPGKLAETLSNPEALKSWFQVWCRKTRKKENISENTCLKIKK